MTMVKKSEIFGFCLFDFANSAYTTIIITTIFSVYFTSKIGSEFLWSIVLAFSYLITLLVSPVAGAMSDFIGKKKRFLFFSYIICVVCTALLYFSRGDTPLWLAFTIGMVALSNFGFSLSEVFVSSFLPEISDRFNIGRISGYAWSFGYVGGLASLIVCFIYLSKNGGTDSAQHFTNVITALFFGVFALPTFILLKERGQGQPLPKGERLLFVGFKRIRETFTEIRKYQDLFKFLVSFFAFSCGISVVISFAAIFAQKELAFRQGEIIMLIFLSNITSAIGAFFFGFVQDKAGAKRTIQITLVLWIIAVLGAFLSHSKGSFWLIANMVGLAMGATQSASRSMVGIFAPPEKNAEFYGFWGVASRAASIAGLVIFGLGVKLAGIRNAILLTAVFFIVGLLLLRYVKEPPMPKKREAWEDA
jgi:MFS transporter, UMF1 family